jgi:rhodanese-related sulfurtransferase/rubrerythrin
MGLKAFFSHLESLEPHELRDFISKRKTDEYILLDVRQPKEYEDDHLPGAKFIPIAQLGDRLDELDPKKPIIAYCAIGGRSSMAARFLASRGFKEIYNLKGGIKAWKGETVSGLVDFHLPFIEEYGTLNKMITLAYEMEDGLGKFYRKLESKTKDEEVRKLLNTLVHWEEKHKERVAALASQHGVSQESLMDVPEKAIMEGGFDMDSFMEENDSFFQSSSGILEVAMMIEAHALDLYLRFADAVEDDETKQVLHTISQEEKTHLASLGQLMEKKS